MKISVFGLGYVGVVTAACLARDGHRVVGVDISQMKVDLINKGESPIIEAEIGDIVREAVARGNLRASTEAVEGIKGSDLAIVCVGTPSRENGSLETRYVETVTTEIGQALRERERPFLLVARSTMIPGTVRELLIPTLESSSGKKMGESIDVVFHPEFLREGTSVYDFYHPPKIVVGERKDSGASKQVLELYENIESPRFVSSIEVAETVKYADNTFHAVKITFANEIGQLCHAHGIDSREVMNIFCRDTKLNISDKYLRPGFAFGGSCLPKDLRAFLHTAQEQNLELPMLGNVLSSNERQINRVLKMILAKKLRSVGFYGLAFKSGTDDLRESPLVELAERLLGKGLKISIVDEFVQVNRLMGKNKAFIEQFFPHLAELLVENLDKLKDCELIILGHKLSKVELEDFLETGRKVLDLSGANLFPGHAQYSTII